MTKRERLQLLITGKTPKILEGFKAFDVGVAELKKNLEENIRVSTLDEVNGKISEVKKKLDFAPLLNAVAQLKNEIQSADTASKSNLEIRLSSLKKELGDADNTNSNNVKGIQSEIESIQTQLAEIYSRKPQDIPDFGKQITDSEAKLLNIIKDFKTADDVEDAKTATKRSKEVQDFTNTIAALRQELITRVNNIGGGNMNRQIFINGVNPLTKFTDMNLKAGSNVTISYQDNPVTHKVDITFASTGGGGGSTRSINSVAVSTLAGSASGTDYVYLCSGTLTITMPTTVGNTNLYTIKNIGAGAITINTTGGETIDGQSTQIMSTQFTSVDLVSNNSGDWAIT